jgi:hypothetical protein
VGNLNGEKEGYEHGRAKPRKEKQKSEETTAEAWCRQGLMIRED